MPKLRSIPQQYIPGGVLDEYQTVAADGRLRRPQLNGKTLERSAMRQLYFDIDGTLLRLGIGDPKPALAAGRFETAIRRAQVDRLVCVGNFCYVVQMVKEVDPCYDSLGVVFRLCQGVFVDEEWFRRVTTLISNPEHRAAGIDFSGDWWYVDDLAERFFDQAGLQNMFRNQFECRIFAPQPDGTGDDVLQWVARIPS